MKSARLMSADQSVLVLVDYQGRLMPAIRDAEQVRERAALLGQVASKLGVPVVATEQNPEKLGPNVDLVGQWCDHTFAKRHFGACADGLDDELAQRYSDRREVVIAGCEAHVCLLQTAMGLCWTLASSFVLPRTPAGPATNPIAHWRWTGWLRLGQSWYLRRWWPLSGLRRSTTHTSAHPPL